jgi:hypothetical protein
MAMQTDLGNEYCALNSFFQKIGISHHMSCPYVHQQNESIECKHRHILDVGLSLSFSSCLYAFEVVLG